MKSLFERLRTRRLASAFIVLAALSAAIVAVSFAAHGVRGQEKQNESSDATPLHVVKSAVPPNEFVKIAKEVGPAVVNINTETLPKQSTTRRRNPHGNIQPPGGGGGDENGGGGQQQGPDDFQNFFKRFFGGRAPDQEGGDDGQVRESLG